MPEVNLHLLIYRYGVSGYPTLKFFPKNNKDGEDYDTSRTLEGFVDFLNEKTGSSRTTTGGLNDNVSFSLNI